MDKKQSKTKELSLRNKEYSIANPTDMSKLAVILKNHIIKNKLYAPIAGKNYVMVEGWQFAGGMMGIFPQVKEVKQIEPNTWMAQVEIIHQKTGQVISTGYALCSKKESKKSSFDEYAILSMAQTRAIGKAYRNIIGWIMKLAGYEATPAEEMVKGKIEATSTEAELQRDIDSLGNSPKIDELKKMLNGKSDEEKLADLKKRAGVQLKDFRITGGHASNLQALLLNQTVTNKEK